MNRNTRRLLAGVGILALTGVACGDDGDDQGAAEAPREASQRASTGANAGSGDGRTITIKLIAFYADPDRGPRRGHRHLAAGRCSHPHGHLRSGGTSRRDRYRETRRHLRFRKYLEGPGLQIHLRRSRANSRSIARFIPRP